MRTLVICTTNSEKEKKGVVQIHASEVYSEITFVENRQYQADLLLFEALYDIANEPIHLSS